MLKASANDKETLSTDAKGKGKVKESTSQDTYAYAQDPHDIYWDEEYSKMMDIGRIIVPEGLSRHRRIKKMPTGPSIILTLFHILD